MENKAFKAFVQAEVRSWLGTRASVIDQVLTRVCESLAPIVTEAVSHGALLHYGDLGTEERSSAVELLRRWLKMADDEYDRVTAWTLTERRTLVEDTEVLVVALKDRKLATGPPDQAGDVPEVEVAEDSHPEKTEF